MAEPSSFNFSAMVPNPHPMLTDTDCLVQIFSFLNLADRRSIALVCRKWRDIVAEAPLPSSPLIVSCERSPPTRFLVQFSGRFGFVRFLPFLPSSKMITLDDTGYRVRIIQPTPSDNSENQGEIGASMESFFRQLWSNYGYSVSSFTFGGDSYGVHELEAALNEPPIPTLQPTLLLDMAGYAHSNLTAISLRSTYIANDVWQILADAVEALTTHGNLKTFCLHDITVRDPDQDAIMPFSIALHRLKRFSCSGLPLPAITAIGEAAAIVEAERAGNHHRPHLNELFLPLRQHFMVTAGQPDMNYLSAVRAGDTVDLELHINNYRDVGVDAAVSEVMQMASHRLRMLDLRFWMPDQYLYEVGGPPPIADLLTELTPVIGSIQEFRLYGTDKCFNDATLSAFVARLSIAPNLRRLSLGKVCGRKVINFGPLGDLVQLEWLYLSNFPKLTDAQFLDIAIRLINLKRLWLMDMPRVTDTTVMAIVNRLEAIEIAKCPMFKAKTFFQQLLNYLVKLSRGDAEVASLADNLEFVKIRNCHIIELKFLAKLVPRFEATGARVLIDKAHHEAILILKNFEKWRDIRSIRLPWFNCEFCGAELSR